MRSRPLCIELKTIRYIESEAKREVLLTQIDAENIIGKQENKTNSALQIGGGSITADVKRIS